MKQLFDDLSIKCSRMTTNSYSTSFSLGTRLLGKKFRDPIHSIYGFVRFADEIVDSFHGFDKAQLLLRFKQDTYQAIEDRISLNPILNSFQRVVHDFNIENELIETFLKSMEMDLHQSFHDIESIKEYILGSAEVVGLMCLRVFTENDEELYQKLKYPAQQLGSAFQKVNFLRDLEADYKTLGRAYFPDVDLENFGQSQKLQIEQEIKAEFDEALKGIMQLPDGAKLGVYTAYIYYTSLLAKIKATSPEKVMQTRIRVPNYEKFFLMMGSYVRMNLFL